jgi:hypothetical protein
MADGGQMLSQLWGNGFLQHFQAGAQIAAQMDQIRQNIAATTFQTNLNVVKQAQDASDAAFKNQLAGQELMVHSENAETERMFAMNKTDPTTKALAQQLQQAKIQSYMNRNPLYAPPGAGPVGAGASGGSSNPDDFGPRLPAAGGAGGLPINAGASTGTASANGDPGVLPALASAPPGQTPGPDNEQTVQIPDADRQEMVRSGLQMASAHADKYGRDWNQTLAFDQTNDSSDNSPSQEEIDSANRIQTFSSTLAASPSAPVTAAPPQAGPNAAGNPMLKAPPADTQQGQPQTQQTPAGAPPAASNTQSVVKPTNGLISRGDGTGYAIRQDSDGTLNKQEFKWKQTGENEGSFLPEGKPVPVKAAAPQSVPPKKMDGMQRKSFTIDAKGGYHATYYDPNNPDDPVTTVKYVYNPDDTVLGRQVITNGKVVRTIVDKEAKEQVLKKPTAADYKDLDAKAAVDVNDQKFKTAAFREKYGRDPASAWTDAGKADWAEAYNLAVQKKADAIRSRLVDLQQANFVVPSQYVKFLNPGPVDTPTSVPVPNGVKVSPGVSKYLPPTKPDGK